MPGVAHIERLQGAQSADGVPPTLLVEVPHGADRARHYHAVRDQLQGELPADLIDFFFVNTDVGAWDLGRSAAAAYLQRRPRETALLVRCLVPRTFVDCNRVLGSEGDLAKDGLTPGLQPYVNAAPDQALLRDLHQAYVTVTDAAYASVIGAGGLCLVPHTYAPRTVGIDRVDDDIVDNLHRVYSPELADTWPLRAPVDLITRDGGGAIQSPPGVADAVVARLAEGGVEAHQNGTYWLHPATRAAQLSARYPGRLLCLEVRRDLVTRRWTPFAEMQPDYDRIATFAQIIGGALADAAHAG